MNDMMLKWYGIKWYDAKMSRLNTYTIVSATLTEVQMNDIFFSAYLQTSQLC